MSGCVGRQFAWARLTNRACVADQTISKKTAHQSLNSASVMATDLHRFPIMETSQAIKAKEALFMLNSNIIDPQVRTTTLEHAVAAVEAAKFEDSPFPHVQIDHFFPPATYTAMLASLPAPDQYEAFAYEKHGNDDGKVNRRRFRLANETLGTLSNDLESLWRTIRSVLGSAALKDAIYQKLGQGIAYRFGCPSELVSACPGFALPELYHETGGYRIKPHPDTRKKVVTMQIALPESDDRAFMGTEFYVRCFRPQAFLREPRGFEIVKTMPFIPNTAFAFVVLNTTRVKSWHGRTTLPLNCPIRNSLLNIWYTKPEFGNPEITADNEAFERRRKSA